MLFETIPIGFELYLNICKKSGQLQLQFSLL